MKARLQPLFFSQTSSQELAVQLSHIDSLLAADAELLEPLEVGSDFSAADAVVLPVIIGEAYSKVEELRAIDVPIIAITSPFGTVAMWDWEIVTFMRSEGITIFSPYTLELAKTFCRTVRIKREMQTSKFLVYQDNPADGMQAEIFKRFYWWEDECTQL